MLKDKREEIYKWLEDHRDYLDRNHRIYDIFTGNLLPYVVEVLEKTLSENYFEKIKERIVPINVLERYVKKVASAYENPPARTANSESNQILVDYYVDELNLNHKMSVADQYSHLFKGYALEPFFDKKPKLRALPFDRFMVMSENSVDPTQETIFIKCMGERYINGEKKKIYYTYSDEEFDAFDSDLDTYDPALEENEGVNPYDVIHFTYGNRSENELIPIQDTDIESMSKLVSIFLSDLSGAILFQCFSIIVGIDLDVENAVMSPNALWSLKSDKASDKNPSIDVIKPQVQIEEVVRFVVSVFTLWLETKGIRVGSIGNIDASNLASGVSKIIDEMDVFKVVKESITGFKQDEKVFWEKMKNVHNAWVDQKLITGMPKFTDDFWVKIEFPEPQPKRNRSDLVSEKKMEVDAGFKSRERAIRELNPEWDDEDVQMEIDMIEKPQEIQIEETDGEI